MTRSLAKAHFCGQDLLRPEKGSFSWPGRATNPDPVHKSGIVKGIAVDRYAGRPWCLVLLKDIYDSEDIERKYQVDKFTQPSGTMETVCRHIGEGRGVAHTSILNTLTTNKLRKAMCVTPPG